MRTCIIARVKITLNTARIARALAQFPSGPAQGARQPSQRCPGQAASSTHHPDQLLVPTRFLLGCSIARKRAKPPMRGQFPTILVRPGSTFAAPAKNHLAPCAWKCVVPCPGAGRASTPPGHTPGCAA